MTMPKLLLAFLFWLLFCLLSSNTGARIVVNEGNKVEQFLPVTRPDHEHNRDTTSHQARTTTLLQGVKAPPSKNSLGPPSTENSMLLQASEDQPTWCIAKPSTDDSLLLANVDFCCGQKVIDCSIIQPGGQCYLPDNNFAHASVDMNLYYKAYNKLPHTCNFKQSGLIISQDPSFGDCIYPS